MIGWDGHMSTSDTVLLLANGASDVEVRAESDLALLQQAVDDVCYDLSQKIIRDAEGAEHFVTIEVSGLATREDAKQQNL